MSPLSDSVGYYPPLPRTFPFGTFFLISIPQYLNLKLVNPISKPNPDPNPELLWFFES